MDVIIAFLCLYTSAWFFILFFLSLCDGVKGIRTYVLNWGRGLTVLIILQHKDCVFTVSELKHVLQVFMQPGHPTHKH